MDRGADGGAAARPSSMAEERESSAARSRGGEEGSPIDRKLEPHQQRFNSVPISIAKTDASRAGKARLEGEEVATGAQAAPPSFGFLLRNRIARPRRKVPDY